VASSLPSFCFLFTPPALDHRAAVSSMVSD
jgi:hypothetical protein